MIRLRFYKISLWWPLGDRLERGEGKRLEIQSKVIATIAESLREGDGRGKRRERMGLRERNHKAQ